MCNWVILRISHYLLAVAITLLILPLSISSFQTTTTTFTSSTPTRHHCHCTRSRNDLRSTNLFNHYTLEEGSTATLLDRPEEVIIDDIPEKGMLIEEGHDCQHNTVIDENIIASSNSDNTYGSTTQFINKQAIENNEPELNQYDRAWSKKYALLRDHYNTHGHTLVPTNDPILGRWVQRQRAQYKQGKMSEHRINLLSDVKFVFNVREYNKSKKHNKQTGDLSASADGANANNIGSIKEKKWHKLSWDVRYEQLTRYHAENGHSNVPLKYGSLGGWVQYQRRSKDKLSTSQVTKLDELDFVWNVNDYQWQQKYEQIREFIQENDHSHLPSTKEYKALQAWCGTQRKLYRAKHNLTDDNSPIIGTASSRTTSVLTDERESLLKDIGFDWKTTHEHTWNQRIQQLKEYKLQHGHVNLGKNDGTLGAWADTQRTEYRFRKMADHQSHLTDSRVKELESIGFVWSIREVQWNEKYDSALRYFMMKTKNEKREDVEEDGDGQTRVPSVKTTTKESSYRLSPSLLVWLRDQKVLYRAMCRGEDNSLTLERAEKLRILLDLESSDKK